MKTIDIMGGKWRVKNIYGGEYEIKIAEVSTHHGLSFCGIYWYDGKEIGIGCFPFAEIEQMTRIEG